MIEKRARRQSSRPRGSHWTDWPALYALLLATAVCAAGVIEGWSHAPAAFFLALLCLIAIHGCLLGLNALTEGSYRWVRCSWGLCALLLFGILTEHPELAFLGFFVQLGSMPLYLLVAAGWLFFVSRLAFYLLRGSAPDAWTWPVEDSLLLRSTAAEPVAWCRSRDAGVACLCADPRIADAHLAVGESRGPLGRSVAATWGRASSSIETSCLGDRRCWTLVVATIALLWYGTPRWGAFRLWRGEFDELARSVVESSPGELPGEGQWIGPWRIDAVAVDPRGGVYLRTWRGQAFVDTLSYGFAHRPNQEGTPFGASGYWLHPVGNDWWVFGASNDWF